MRLSHALAIESEYFRSDMIEVTEFPQLINKYNVRGVPKTVINEKIDFEGMIPEHKLIDELIAKL